MSLTPLSAPPGLNSDETSFSAAGQWTDGNNVRFFEGKPEAVVGGGSVGAIPAGTSCSSMDAVGATHIFYGTYSKLYVGTSIASPLSVTDITPAAFAGAGPSGWAFDGYGTEALAAPVGGSLYRWTGSGVAAIVSVAPAAMYDMLVTSERQVLAFGTNEQVSGTLNRMCIRGSDLEDYTSSGSWTTSSTNNAFEHILEGSGYIVAARRVGQYIAVWTNAALYIGQFIGDPGQAYKFDIVDQVPGPTSREAACVIDGTAYWMGTDLRLHVWSPGALPGVIPCPISSDLQQNYDTGGPETDRMVVAPVYDEIWFFYSDQRDGRTGYPSRYVAYASKESAAAQRPVWFRGTMSRTAMCAAPFVNAASHSPFAWLAADDLTVDRQGEAAHPGSLAPSITLGDIYLDSGGRRAMVRRFIPDFSGQVGNISLTINIRNRPQSTPVAKGPYTIATTDTKKDFRVSGMIASFTFSGSGAAAFRFGKPCIDVIPMGER